MMERRGSVQLTFHLDILDKMKEQIICNIFYV